MKVSIAICTWNRSRLLRMTLESLSQLNVPQSLKDQWELLIVNNASTDDTSQVIESFQNKLPVKVIFQPVQGHAISRNTAVENVTGEFLIWTDNDVRVRKDWLSSYFESFQRYPECVYFGGPIEPRFESGKPEWIDETWDKCKGVYAERQLGMDERPLGDGTFPYGANFAIKTSIQQEYLFDVDRGRKGSGLVGDDEIDLLTRLSQAGHQGRWVPKAALEHIIPKDRATTDYVSRYFIGQGQINILRGKVDKKAGKALREALKFRLKWKLKQRFGSAEEWVSHMIRASLSWGEYLAIKHINRQAKSKPNSS